MKHDAEPVTKGHYNMQIDADAFLVRFMDILQDILKSNSEILVDISSRMPEGEDKRRLIGVSNSLSHILSQTRE